MEDDGSLRFLRIEADVNSRHFNCPETNHKKSLCKKIYAISHSRIKYNEIEIKRKLSSWIGWAKYCDSKHLIKKLSKTINYEINIEHKALRAS